MKKAPCRFINRDISWTEFNSRVLDEAADPGNPLLERLNFISIVSNNLDEFCMVRLAGVSSQIDKGYKKVYKDYGYEPVQLMAELKRRILRLVERQYRCLEEEILPQLEKHAVRIVEWEHLTASQKNTAASIMNSEIYPVLTPIAIDSEHPFPLVPNLGLEMLIRLIPEKSKTEKFALLEVPAVIPRFIPLENSAERLVFIPAEDLIRNHLSLLFAGAEIRECSVFRVTRDMDFSLEADSVSDLLNELQLALRKKTKRSVIRLEYSSDMSSKSRKWLISQLKIDPEKVLIQPIGGLLDLKAMSELASLQHQPELHNPPLPVHFLNERDIFRSIRENGPFLLHHPFLSFDPVLRLLESAAEDPDVLAIKQTLYRAGGGTSPVVQTLIRAARNGKQVTVLVELKARFEEQNNMNWAMELAEAGAHVVYGVAKLKIHCKALLVIRREENGIHRYVHLSSGNYNSKTACRYTDLGFFSDDPLLVRDVSALFNVITGFSAPPSWNRLIVAPFTLREKVLSMIDQEARCSTPENPGRIIIKINSLIDYEVIEHLYQAAEKNVRIDLIVRGICGLTPCAVSAKAAANIRIVSIIDRFLEHSRIYYFAGNGSPQYYIGSADLMPRNLNRRVEILVPVDSPAHRKELDFILQTILADERKGRHVCGFNQYTSILKKPGPENTRSQLALYGYYKERYQRESGKSKLSDSSFRVFRDISPV